MLQKFSTALTAGGALLTGVAFLVGAVTERTIAPVENVYDEIASSPASSPASSICPDGWTDTSAIDEHHAVLSCERTLNEAHWLVILNADGSFNQATILDVPGAVWITDESLVPGWR